MSLYSTFESDPKAETEGIILDLGFNSKEQPIEIRIRRAGGNNVLFAKAFERHTRSFRKLLEIPGAVDPRRQQRAMIEVYADAVVVGWSGVEDRDGNPMEFTRDNVVKLFTDLPNLFQLVMRDSQNEALFRAHLREEEAGN